ncbi:18443_t:CDS:2 [Funneliformis geosporum]|uniref:GrpE protein homolog, mitochondrial n=1 Tax=Funneliformis geosporum TaxID=1117311 RepID=A0A9W4SG10_9GLOM|nr:18443_t:CDS:2 [Funneliformis geosporum]
MDKKNEKENFSQKKSDETETPKTENKDSQANPTELKTPEKENIVELKKEIENLKDKNLRLLAEMDNQRKIHFREMIEKTKYSNEKLIRQFLFFPDNYEKAMQISQHDTDPKIRNFLVGFQMILDEFRNVLKMYGVEEIKVTPLKDIYDEKLHGKTLKVEEIKENDKYPEGTILQISQKGYKIYERVLRPVQIKIRTTNSCVAVFEGAGVKVILNNESGKNTTPSVVSFRENGEKDIVGESAKNQAVSRPGRVVFEAKRLIGMKFNTKEVQEFRKTAPFKIIEHENGDA